MLNQQKINQVWQKVWEKESKTPLKKNFSNRLFIEGFSSYAKHLKPEFRKILEVGSGSGRYGLRIAKTLPLSEVVCTDILDQSLSLISYWAEELELKNIKVQKEDVMFMSFPDNHFDLVFCDVVIQHLTNPLTAIQEMIRVLKPGGSLIISAVNIWNPYHSAYKAWLKLLGKQYDYVYEKSYSRKELKKIIKKNNLTLTALDGFYPAYGLFRLKKYFKPFAFFGKLINRLTVPLDKLSGGFFSSRFGFEIYAVAKKEHEQLVIKTSNSGFIRLKFYNDYPDGNLVIAEAQKNLPFEIKRVYYINNLHSVSSTRGNHAHKDLEQYIFCVSGSFKLLLDDGTIKQELYLNNPYLGVRLGPKLWHIMSDFSDNCVILVLADDYYNEEDYIRNYTEFLDYVKNNPSKNLV